METSYFEDETIDLSLVSDYECKEFIGCDFSALDLSEKSFKDTLFNECIFTKCDLSNISLSGARFRDVTFNDCKILGVDFTQVSLSEDLSFAESVLDFAVFQGLDIRNLKMINCSVNDADFAGSNLVGSNFSGTCLKNTSFNDCDLSKANFTDASDYFIDPKFTRIDKAKFSLPEAMVFFEALNIDIA